MKHITVIAVIIALATGVWLGVRWAYAGNRRWIIRGEDLQF